MLEELSDYLSSFKDYAKEEKVIFHELDHDKIKSKLKMIKSLGQKIDPNVYLNEEDIQFYYNGVKKEALRKIQMLQNMTKELNKLNN